MSLPDGVRARFFASDRRSVREVESEIAEEIDFHLAMRARDNLAAGLREEDARADARHRFGDVERVARACRRAQLGERIMLQRLNAFLLVTVLAALGVLAAHSWSSSRENAATLAELRTSLAVLNDAVRSTERAEVRESAALGETAPPGRTALGVERSSAAPPIRRATPQDPEAWLRRFDGADWREAFRLGSAIADLPPEEGIALLRAIFPRIATVAQRQQVLKAFAFERGHPFVLEALHLGAADAELAVQGWAFQYLKDYAFRDFSGDDDAYLRWREGSAGRPVGEVLVDSARDLVARMRGLEGASLAAALREVAKLDLRPADAAGVDLRTVLREAGALDLAEKWIAERALDAANAATALRWLESLRPDEPYLRRVVLPILADQKSFDAEILGAACRAVGAGGGEWAAEPLECFLRDTLRAKAEPLGEVYAAAMALSALGAKRSVPTLIGMIVANDAYATRYGIGHFALTPLTGVEYDEAHDGAWWTAWWAANRQRVAPELASVEIPRIDLSR